jgi:predicted site-specific integrase-resolvase
MGEAMTLLNVCRKTMRKYCEDGTVSAYKLPGSRGDWRIKADSLDYIRNAVEKKALEHLRKHGL